MTSIAIDRRDGLSSATAVKGPCRVATTANVTLSGLQTVNGVALTAEDRVLVKSQTDGVENGIYVADTGTWERAKDFSRNRDVRKGTQVYVTNGSTGVGWYGVTTSDPIEIDTTAITFAQTTEVDSDFTPSFAGAATGPIRRALEMIPGLHLFKASDASDDGEALDAAIDYSEVTSFLAAPGRAMAWNSVSDGVFIPPGSYTFDSAAAISLASTANLIVWAIPGTVTIRIIEDIYLFELSGLVQNIYLKGLHFVGGKGALKLTGTASNVAGMRVIEDCYFDNYTECAIGNNSSDSPYWKFVRCMFMGVVGGGTIGIAVGGYLDSSVIEDCAFLRNKYNVKVGPRLSGNITIRNCDFVAFTAGVIEADIWIVPNNTEAGGTNSGAPLLIENCKFGNENISATKPRVLVALEGAGADRQTKDHSTTWNDTDAFLSGVIFRGNRISADSNVTGPFMYSYIHELNEVKWDGSNVFDGGQHSYLCEFNTAAITADNAYTTRMWDVTLGYSGPSVRAFSSGVSNRLVGLVTDVFGSAAFDESVELKGQGDPARIKLLFNTGTSMDNGVGASKTNVTDALGNASRAAEGTFGGSAGSNGFSKAIYSIVAPTAERVTWVELDLKQAASRSVSEVVVEVFNFGNSRFAVRRRIKLPASWRTFRIPFILPAAANMSNWQVRIVPVDYSAGVADRVQFGRIHCYHARTTETAGHIQTLGDGLWNGEHLILGANHIWQNADGRLRHHTAAPSADTDGSELTEVVTTWTPTLLFGGGNTGMTGTFTGTYIKRGRQVTLQWVIVLTAKGSSTGAATIGGIPFAAWGGGIAHSGNIGYAANVAAADGISVLVSAGGVALALYEDAGGTSAALTEADFADNSQIQGSLTYIIPPTS